MSEIIQMIADDLLLPVHELRHTVTYAPLRNRRFTIPNRSGGRRPIIQPAVKLKPILSWLDAVLLSKLPVHKSATAFRQGKSILENTSAHCQSRYSVRVDISKFFPSIRRQDLIQAIHSTTGLPSWAYAAEALSLVTKVCFDRDGRLPIGYSTSPSIANAVMYKIDSELAEKISRETKFGRAVVTRYADDFVFSTDQEGACNLFVDLLAQVLAENKCPELSINQAKTRFMSKAGGSTLITGLRVNNEGNIVVHANYRDHVRLMLKLYKSGRLKSEDVPKLVGHLAYVQHVDPALFTKLSFKFYQEINRLRSGFMAPS
jgi:RNA-directed DNA polymerase